MKHLLGAQNKISVVQLTNLEALPPTGVHVTVAPLKLSGGAGGPARVFAVASRGHHHGHRGGRRDHDGRGHTTNSHMHLRSGEGEKVRRWYVALFLGKGGGARWRYSYGGKNWETTMLFSIFFCF